MKKTGLVLEGGGMRGAYTAGALAWLLEHDVKFDYGVGISAGALHLCNFMMKDAKMLYDLSVKYTADSHNVGLYPLFHERSYVGYDFLFEDVLKKRAKLDLSALQNNKTDMEIGVYDLNVCKTIWVNQHELDADLVLLKAACTLPLAGKIVPYKNRKYIDGGITTMVPIKRSIINDCKKHFVIITKDESYVRKPSGKLMAIALKGVYHKYPKLQQDMAKRSEVYYEEMGIVEKLVSTKEAFLLRPTQDYGVKRFSGDEKQLEALYHLGYDDCEARKAEILNFMKEK